MTLLNIKLSNGTKRLVKYTPPNKGTVVIGGRTYRTVKIGNQWWLAENLDYKFNISDGTGSYAYYDNDEATYGIDGTYKCGLLYDGYAASYLESNKDVLLPTGWHVPTVDEWNTLFASVGGSSTAGTKLKALNNSVTSNWPSGWNGTDDYGISILPSGFYYSYFQQFGSRATLCTSSESNPRYGIYIGINTGAPVSTESSNKDVKGAIRLVKDA